VKLLTDPAAIRRYLSSITSRTRTAGFQSMSKQKTRSASDRRMRDLGPPEKVAERRHKAERRLPELTDLPYEEFEAELAALGKQAAVFLRRFSSGQ
jgi:hypothetical protein